MEEEPPCPQTVDEERKIVVSFTDRYDIIYLSIGKKMKKFTDFSKNLMNLSREDIIAIKADGRHPDEMSSEWPLTSRQILQVLRMETPDE